MSTYDYSDRIPHPSEWDLEPGERVCRKCRKKLYEGETHDCPERRKELLSLMPDLTKP